MSLQGFPGPKGRIPKAQGSALGIPHIDSVPSKGTFTSDPLRRPAPNTKYLTPNA